MGERLARLDKAIDRLVATAPSHMQAVIEALQALRGEADGIMTAPGKSPFFRRQATRSAIDRYSQEHCVGVALPFV